MYVVLVTFNIKEEHIDDFHTAVLQQAKNSLELEEDCHRFDVCINANTPKLFLLYEWYTDPAAFEAHLKSEHFLEFNTTVSNWVNSKNVTYWNTEQK